MFGAALHRSGLPVRASIVAQAAQHAVTMCHLMSMPMQASKNWRQMHHTLINNTAGAMHTQDMGANQVQVAHSKPA